MSLDAFNRLRTSNPFTLFNYYPTPLTGSSNLDEDMWINLTSNSGAISSYNSKNYIDLNLTANGSYALMQSKVCIDYLSGKSRLIYMTGLLLSRAISGDTLTSRIGIMNLDSSTPPNPTAGVYFQIDGTNLQWVNVTQDNSGTVTTTVVNQSSWNIDTFNGAGPSGLTLNISSALSTFLIFIEQEWLGTGGIKVGFIINNTMYYANFFSNSGLSVQYTTTPRQRLTYYINGTTITASISNRMMCSTTISEGGYFPLGRRNSITTTSNGVSMSAANTKYVVLVLQLNSSYVNGMLKTLNMTVSYSGGTSKTAVFELQLHSTYGSIEATNPALSTLSFINLKDSIGQYFIGTGAQTVTTDGYLLSSGSAATQTNIDFTRNDFETLLSRAICTRYSGGGSSYVDTLVLCASSSSANSTIFASMDFIESL